MSEGEELAQLGRGAEERVHEELGIWENGVNQIFAYIMLTVKL